MLKPEHLLAFCLAAKEQSISAAAKQLGLSQPAVSGQLAALQKQVGKVLYQRSSHGIELTPAGKELLPYACALAKTYQQTQAYLRGDSDRGNIQLQVGLSHHLVPLFTGILLKATRSYNREKAALEVHLREDYSDRLLHLVKQRDLDAAFIIANDLQQFSPLRLEPMATEAIILLVKPDDPLAQDKRVAIHLMQDETLILSSSQSEVYRKVLRCLRDNQVKPGRILEVSGPEAVKAAVLDGLGIGVTLASYVAREIRAGWLTSVEVQEQSFKVNIVKISHDLESLDPKKAEALAEILRLPGSFTSRYHLV